MLPGVSPVLLAFALAADPPGIRPTGPAYDGPHLCGEDRVRFACALTDDRLVSVCGDHPAHLVGRIGRPGVPPEVEVGNHGSLSKYSGVGFDASKPFRTEIQLYPDVTRYAFVATVDLGGLEVTPWKGAETWVSCTSAPRVDFWMLDLLPGSLMPPGGVRADGPAARTARPEAVGTLCEPHELPTFSCVLDNGKQVAVCGQRTYRFGRPGAIELEYTTPTYGGGGPMGFSQRSVDGEMRTSFYTQRPWRYELYSTKSAGGVRVFSGTTQRAELRCKGPPTTRYDALGAGSGLPPPPWHGH